MAAQSAHVDEDENNDPMLAACFQSDVERVKYLISVGVDVNRTECNSWTPLMMASSGGHPNIVRYLLRCGADVNQQTMNGNNAVHQCVEYDRLECLKILMKNGAQLDIKYHGMTPLQMASTRGKVEMVKYLIGLPSCSIAEEIEALELLGTCYAEYEGGFERAHHYWLRSLEEREAAEPGDNVPPKRQLPHPAFDAIEFETEEELTNMRFDIDELSMQSLLIKERVFGRQHSHTVTSVVRQATEYADEGNFHRSNTLMAYILDVQQNSDGVCEWTLEELCSLIHMFSKLMFEGSPVKYKDMLAVFIKAVDVLQHEMRRDIIHPWHSTEGYFDLESVVQSVSDLSQLQASASEDERLEFHRVLYRLVHLNVRDDQGDTPLHCACILPMAPLDVVQLLLDAGADPDAVSLNGDTLLHSVANNHSTQPQLVNLLLKSGVHHDACNCQGRNFTQEWAFRKQLMPDQSVEFYNPMEYCSLQCLAAKAVKRYGIPYQFKVPTNVAEFTKLH